MTKGRVPRAFTEEELRLLAASGDELAEWTKEMSFDIDRLVARLKGERWQQILQAHLYFDHVLSALLKEELRHPDAIDVKRMSFAQKLQLVHAIGLVRSDIVPTIAAVNRVRNRLAHDLEAEIGDGEVQQLTNTVPSWFKKQVMKPEEWKGPDVLRDTLVYLLAFLDGERQRQALRRLQQRKAYLNAARVLDQIDVPYAP